MTRPMSQQGYPVQQQGYPMSQPGYPQPAYPGQGSYPPPPAYPGQGYYSPPPAGNYPQTPQIPPPDNNDDLEDAEVKGFKFNDQSIRKAFIRKVYSILFIQLVITFGIICLFVFVEPLKQWTKKHRELLYVSSGVLFVTVIVLGCCADIRRKAPMNFIFLGLFTIAQSFALSVVAVRYRYDVVLIAVGITAIVCISLTLFAFQTACDFTVLGGILFVTLIILMVFGIVMIFVPKNKTMMIVYSSLGAFLFSIYLIYHTQLMFGGKHKYAIDPEEYIFAALNLYVDIVQLFMHILQLVGLTKDED